MLLCRALKFGLGGLLLLGPVMCGPDKPPVATDPVLEAALACPMYANAGISIDCAGYQRWLNSLESQGEAPDAELFTLLAAPDKKRRWLGAAGLLRRGRDFVTDTRVFDALDRERFGPVAMLLGQAAARVTHADAPRRAASVARSHPLSAARAALLGSLAFHQPTDWARKLTVERSTEDPDSTVRQAACAGLKAAGHGGCSTSQ